MHRRIEARIVNPLLGEQIPVPSYATDGSAALDLRACIEAPITLRAGSRELIKTGLADFLQAPGRTRHAAVQPVGVDHEEQGQQQARRDADPDSLVNRPVRIHLRPITGAPGDGNRALARHMREQLIRLGMTVQDKAEGADYAVGAEVSLADMPGNQQRVEIRWRVADARGAEAGQVAQLNQVPRGTLAGLWADVALVVAQEAAGGIKDVIGNQTNPRRAPVPPAPRS
jgi:hypothetical protein